MHIVCIEHISLITTKEILLYTYTRKKEALLMNKLSIFEDYIIGIDKKEIQDKFRDLLIFVIEKFPFLETAVKWNQPMFLNKGTFIISFNASKKNLNIAPEIAAMTHFQELIQQSDVTHTKMYVQMNWDKPFDLNLIEELIEYNIKDKNNMSTFWRKQ